MKAFRLVVTLMMCLPGCSASSSPHAREAEHDAAPASSAEAGTMDAGPTAPPDSHALDAGADGGTTPQQLLAVALTNDEGFRVLTLEMVRGRVLQQHEVARGSRAPGWMLRFSPDGRYLAFVAAMRRGHGLYVHDVTTRETTILDTLTGLAGDPKLAWAPDGARLAVGIDSEAASWVNVYELGTPDAAPHELRADSGSLWLADGERSWSRTGRSLALLGDGAHSATAAWHLPNAPWSQLERSFCRCRRAMLGRHAIPPPQLRRHDRCRGLFQTGAALAAPVYALRPDGGACGESASAWPCCGTSQRRNLGG